MADCSYARCLQERRSIKRELQRWTKNMVYVVGLERVAEELMGSRKWKLYQNVLLARNLPLQQPDDNDTLSDTAQQEEEDPMIATTEAIQRHADLVSSDREADKQQDETTEHRKPGSPITLDEDSKDGRTEPSTRQSSEDENQPARDDAQPSAGGAVQSVLKIKTIEEINTVGVDGGAKEGATEGGETILEGLIKRTSSGPPRRPLPADWTPQDKCYFCVDGKLVRPGANNAAEPAAEQVPSPAESESESSSSRSGTSPPRNQFLLNSQAQAQAQALAAQLILHQQQASRLNPSMNTVQSMTASLIAALGAGGAPNLQALGMCPPASLLPHWLLNARANSTPERSLTDCEKDLIGAGLTSPLTTEQPLDLSSKSSAPLDADSKLLGDVSHLASPSTLESRLASLRVPPIDPKQIFKSKPRLVPTGGRRAYSERELQAALHDIQSGKLGTRRAAVLYNIPRSTLRNKVYKLEREKESRIPGSHSASMDRDDSNDIGDDLEDDKDSTMEEDKDDDKDLPRPPLSMEEMLRYSQMDPSGLGNVDNLRMLLQKGGQKFFDMGSPKRDAVPDIWAGIDPGALAPYIQSILFASGIPPMAKPEESGMPGMPEIVRLLAEEQRNILKEQLLKQDHLNNGKSADQCEEDALTKRIFSRQSSSASSVITKNERSTPNRKTDSPDEPMEIVDNDGGESRDSPSNVILKIPSFKPVANTPNSSKNGGDSFPGVATSPLPYFSRSPHPEQNAGMPSRTGAVDHFSPPLGGHPKTFVLKDVIANSINQKFHQHVSPTNHNDMHQMKVGSQNMDVMEGLSALKRGNLTPPMGQGMPGQGISVIKNLASHDLTRNFTNNNSSNQSQANNATGGKGTRPKRGKYRNYDRDSLVEAVKAVQRGEMSVHRAGSYYGVPHSTLEYKVKERHLMRPRKREPKNINPDDKTTVPSASKSSDIPGSGTLRLDKSKTVPKQPTKPSYPSSSPNGLKMPPGIFDPALALGYNSPFPFWPHAPPFSGMPVDFPPRNPGSSGSFPTESFFASHMMQKLHEESARHPNASSHKGVPNSLLKTREMAELYENPGANGSFLEGIIRSSLAQNSQSSRTSDQEEGSRRLRQDDMMLAEEMRDAVRRVREASGRAAPSSTSTPAPGSAGNSPSHPT